MAFDAQDEIRPFSPGQQISKHEAALIAREVRGIRGRADSDLIEDAMQGIEYSRLRIWWQGNEEKNKGELGPFKNAKDVAAKLGEFAKRMAGKGVGRVLLTGFNEPGKGIHVNARGSGLVEVGISY